jgi:hypothetical protein
VIALLLIPTLLSGFDIGGSVGAAFPATGLSATHTSSARLAAALGWSSGPSRIEFGYSYAGLPGPQSSAYRLDLGEVALRYVYEFVRRPAWGIALAAGPGYGFVRRTLYAAQEDGRSPSAHIGIDLLQHQGRNRLNLEYDNVIYFSSRPAGDVTRTATVWLATLSAGVSYGF